MRHRDYSTLDGRAILRKAATILVILLVIQVSLVYGKARAPYSRINMGSTYSAKGRYQMQDSVSREPGTSVQTGSRYRVTSSKVMGNNGVATALGETSIMLVWNESTTESILGYMVMRGNSPYDSFESVGEVSSDSCEFVDDDLLPGTNYYYRVLIRDADSNLHIWTETLWARTEGDPPSTPTPVPTLTPAPPPVQSSVDKWDDYR